MDKLERKEKISAMHRDNIVKASETLFSEKGYDKTTMDDIAKLSSYSKRTIYVYFKSKEEIYTYIVFNGMVHLKNLFENAVSSSKDVIDGYYKVCNALISFHDTNLLYYNATIHAQSLVYDNKPIDDINTKIFNVGEQINTCIENLFRKGISQGIIRKELKFPHTIFVFWSSLTGIIDITYNKEAYILKVMGEDKNAFLKYGFDMLLKSIIKEG